MFRSMIKKDFLRNRTTNITLLIFIILSAYLMASSFHLIAATYSSINRLYDIAKPPHFLQMHKGEIDENEIAALAKATDYVTSYQVVPMIDIDGSDIYIMSHGEEVSMGDSVLDNGFVVNPEPYDQLLDMNNQRVDIKPGEIGVPVIYKDTYEIKVGDRIKISNGKFSKEFVVSCFIRDAQMNSSMCSSTRFAVNAADHEQMKDKIGEIEYEIEYYFTSTSYANGFTTIYEDNVHAVNGQAITYTLMKLLSSFSDLMQAVIIGMVSLLVIFISTLCLRYTIRTVMEGEVHEIGTMRAIGLAKTDITSLYLTKYRMLAITGCIVGYIAALCSNQVFTAHINRTFGPVNISVISILIPILGIGLVYLLVMRCCKKILKKSSKITVVEALVTGKKEKKMNKGMMFWIILVCVAMILLPMHLNTTISSPSFASYMGSTESDISIRLQTADGLQEKYEQILDVLNTDLDIASYNVYAECKYKAIDKEGNSANIRIAYGDYSNSTIKYLSGTSPKTNDEIAVSQLNADLFAIKTGDTMTLYDGEKKMNVKISGIYQDVTDGGFTAKMQGKDDDKKAVLYSASIFLKDNVSITKTLEELSAKMPAGTKILATKDYMGKTLESLRAVTKTASVVITIVAVCLIALITVLHTKLQMAQDFSQIATLKAIGFSSKDIGKSYLIKQCKIAAIGIIAGILLVAVFGEPVVGLMLSASGRGLSKVALIVNPMLTYVICPIAVLFVVAVSTWLCNQSIKDYRIIDLINE